MGKFNTGSTTDFDSIGDYETAIVDFSEGDESLKELLSNCFSRTIKTVACCIGHERDNSNPYIAFQYYPQNEQYIYAIMEKLKDSKYTFRYNKLSDGKSYFSIEDKKYKDYSIGSVLFNDINNIINSFNKNMNYYDNLPLDLKEYGLIMKLAENDEALNTVNDFFQMTYEKKDDGYMYCMITNDLNYADYAQRCGFKKIDSNSIISVYQLAITSRRIGYLHLDKLVSNINEYGCILDQPLEIIFEDDGLIRNNFQIHVDIGDDLESIAEKLMICKQKGINAFAIFNGIEISNYCSENVQQIIMSYYLAYERKRNDQKIK